MSSGVCIAISRQGDGLLDGDNTYETVSAPLLAEAPVGRCWQAGRSASVNGFRMARVDAAIRLSRIPQPVCQRTTSRSACNRRPRLRCTRSGWRKPQRRAKAVECLLKDREALLAFFDFPAEHWIHIRSTNVIESGFARSGIAPIARRGA